MLDNLVLGAIIIVGCYFALQMLNILRIVFMNSLHDIDCDCDHKDDKIEIDGKQTSENEISVNDGSSKVESETIILKKND